MCGIAGIIYKSEFTQGSIVSTLNEMASALFHRGPDGEGYLVHENVGLAHRRLSIVDLSDRGKQPMETADGNIAITFNGEIFNFSSLKTAYLSQVPFVSGTDTEVLLNLYASQGIDCLHSLNGMFAFAILDKPKGQLILVRDRFGVKPVYFYNDDSRFLFASEIPALIAGGANREFDPVAAIDWATHGITANDRGLIRNCELLPSGSMLIYDLNLNRYEIKYYYRARPDSVCLNELGASRERWIDAIETKLVDAVELRLVADVTVGTYCSGGVDSSLITAIAARNHSDLQAFNVSVSDHPLSDEHVYAKAVADHLGVKLNTLNLTADLFRENFVRTVFRSGTPLSFVNTVPLMMVSEMAKERGVKVLLSGEGADECFGGYIGLNMNNALPIALASLIGKFPASLVMKFFNFFIALGQRQGLLNAYPIYGGVPGVAGVLSGDLGIYTRSLSTDAIFSHITELNERKFTQALLGQIEGYMQPILLRTDASSMAASIEARTPFLDYRLVELAMSCPPRFKVGIKRGRVVGKSILKDVALRYLPEKIVHRSKVGFGMPASYYTGCWPDKWFADSFVCKSFGLASQDFRVWQKALVTQSAAWILGLEVWGRLFIRNQPVEQVQEEFNQIAWCKV